MFYYLYMTLSYVLECHAHMATYKTPSLFPRRVLTNLISPFSPASTGLTQFLQKE